MKKKIALALAAILTLSAMPMTIFAGSDNRINQDIMLVPKKTAFRVGYGNGASGTLKLTSGGVVSGTSASSTVKAVTYFEDAEKRKEIDGTTYVAPELVLELKDTLKVGSAFRLKMTNAQWLLTAIRTNSGTDKIAQSVAYNDTELNRHTTGIVGSLPKYEFVSMIDDGTDINTNTTPIAAATTYAPVTDAYGATTKYGYYHKATSANDVSYLLEVDKNNPEEAVVTIVDQSTLSKTTGGDYPTTATNGLRSIIKVPLTAYIEEEGVDASVAIVDNNSAVTSGSWVFASTRSGSTINSVRTIKSGKELIALDTVVLKETRTNSIDNEGAFEIIAPQGYEFVNTPDKWVIESNKDTKGSGFSFESGISSLATVAYIPTYKKTNESFGLYYTGVGKSGASGASNVPGSLTISGIKIQPQDGTNVPVGQELKMETRTMKYDTTTTSSNGVWQMAYGTPVSGSLPNNNVSGAELGELGVQATSFPVAKAVDWKVSLTTSGDVPTLVSGRFNETRAENPIHKSVKVTFSEEELSAWLESRTTTFRLPEGVKIRGIKFDSKTNLKGFPTDVLGTELDGYNVNANENLDYTKTKYIDKTGILTVGENYFSLKAARRDNDKTRSKLDMFLYLSIDPNYDSNEIPLTVEGTAIPEEVPPVVIAKVQKPIEIQTRTTDVQIGFQNYKVADVVIKETMAGAISKTGGTSTVLNSAGTVVTIADGGSFVVGISDSYNDTDVKFAPVSNSQVTIDGDLKMTLLKTNDGTVTFDVDRPSSTPSTITIKGLEIKIDRTVPYGKYDLVVYGKSVFANYAKLVPDSGSGATDVLNKVVAFNTNKDGFKYPAFVDVKTEGSNSTLKANVKVQAGSTTAIVDGKAVELPMAPANVNGRIMVPLKFMANVFGIEDGNIIWYDGNLYNDPGNRIATVTYGATTVEFKIGSPTYIMNKNGAKITRPIDDQGTKAYIDAQSGRIFLPFAAMGDAFGIQSKWDDSTKTAEYNPSLE